MGDNKSRIEAIPGLVSFDKVNAKSQEQDSLLKEQDSLLKELQDKVKEFIDSKLTGASELSKATLNKEGRYVNDDPKFTETDRALELYKVTMKLDKNHKKALEYGAISVLTKTNNNDENYESKKMCSMTILQTLVDCKYNLTEAHSQIFQEKLVKELTSANGANTRSIAETRTMMGYLSDSNLQKVLNTASDRAGNRKTNASLRLESLQQLKAVIDDGVDLTQSQQGNLEKGSNWSKYRDLKAVVKTIKQVFKSNP